MAIKTNVNKKVDLDVLKTKLFNDISMMHGIKVKGVDSTSNSIIISLKIGKCTITDFGESLNIISKARLFPLWTWDLILDRIKIKKVHARILNIINSF